MSFSDERKLFPEDIVLTNTQTNTQVDTAENIHCATPVENKQTNKQTKRFC